MLKDLRRGYIGIDPGKAGGIVLLIVRGEQVSEPVMVGFPGDASSAALEIKKLVSMCDDVLLCAIEQVHATPVWGRASSFKFGLNYGSLIGVVAALDIPFVMVTPKKWQSAMLDSGTGETKERSLNMARRLYPKFDWKKSKDGLADALHIARYAMQYDGVK